MKRYLLIFITMLSLVIPHAARAQYYSVNFDVKTVGAMVAAYATGTGAEAYYNEQIKQIVEHYTAAELSAASIFASKYLDRRAYTELGLWSSSTENYYYKRIYNLVSAKIMPKIWAVGGMMLKSPHNALNWGSYLMKVCDDTKALCMQFESVVTNSTLSFKDIAFLQFNQQAANLFNLSNMNGVNFKGLLNYFGNIGKNFTADKLKADMTNLYQKGVSLALSGIDGFKSNLLQTNNFTQLQNGNIGLVMNIVRNYSNLFHSFENGIGSGLLDLIGGEQAVASLFDISDYNMTSWIDDYVRESTGQYYTQRWYIYSRDTGNEPVCQYNPPSDEKAITDGPHWYRIKTKDANFTPSPNQREAILCNSEAHAGWSRNRVNQLNAQSKEVTYKMNHSLKSYRINNIFGKIKQKAYAYSITVTKYWDKTNIVYETFFDSYSMSEAVFKAQLNLKLAELNNNTDGIVYYLGSDPKRYYQTTDAKRLEGVETATISVTCDGGAKLSESASKYKCRKCGSTLTPHTKECAMRSTIDIGDEVGDLDKLESSIKAEIETINKEIASLEERNREIQRLLINAPSTAAADLRLELNGNLDKIAGLKAKRNEYNEQLKDLEASRNEAQNDNVQTDDYNRIPSIMNKLKNDFGLTWKNRGSWSGYTYVRKATIPNIRGDVTFTASLSIIRKPKYFLGIKFLRAIVQISWKLTTAYSDTNVVEVITLDPSMDAKQKEKIVNKKISEVARMYPDCAISTEYARSEPLQTDDTEDKYHLLWSCDRLEIAREIDTRLTKIYTDLVALEKMMSYKHSIIDALKQHAPHINDTQGKKQTIVEECHERWMLNASGKKQNVQPAKDGRS